MDIDTRVMESAGATELYVTGVPSPGLPVDRQGDEVFGAIRSTLAAAGARILQERVFAARDAAEALAPIRAKAYGDLDDGTPPAWLAVAPGLTGPLAGVQVHAVRSAQKPRLLQLNGSFCGRALRCGGGEFLALSGLTAPEAGDAPRQARAMFEKAEAILRQAGGDMRSVVRTWVWLGDILSWYGDFNRVRNEFFLERGLLNGKPGGDRLPASTGIGIGPAATARCALDVVAVLGAEPSAQFLRAAGRQDSAFKYGSAFSRASRTRTPAGEAVFVSGTAAINADGVTQFVGDCDGQIRMTLDNVRAVLRETQCDDRDVVHAIAYCKTPAVEQAFQKVRRKLPWPWVVMICDICRDDLLFEVEATACPGAGKVQPQPAR